MTFDGARLARLDICDKALNKSLFEADSDGDGRRMLLTSSLKMTLSMQTLTEMVLEIMRMFIRLTRLRHRTRMVMV